MNNAQSAVQTSANPKPDRADLGRSAPCEISFESRDWETILDDLYLLAFRGAGDRET